MNRFKQLLAERATHTPLGTWVMSASPLVAEAVGVAGFDWGVLDMEHTPLDLMDLVHMMQAVAGTPMVPLVRVPWNDAVNVKRVLDAGADSLPPCRVWTACSSARATCRARWAMSASSPTPK